MVKSIIGAIAAFMTALVLALCKAAGKASRLEEEKELEEQKNEILRKQMETVNEVRKELKLVEKEPEPEVVEAPPAGDSSSRLDRLNRLHDSSKGSGNSCTLNLYGSDVGHGSGASGSSGFSRSPMVLFQWALLHWRE